MKKVKCVAIQTARGGSIGVKNKNMMVLNGIPLFLHNIINLNKSKYVNDIFLTTDIKELEKYQEYADFKIIERPEYLSTSTSSHYDAMRHAYDIIAKEIECEYVCIVLGNSIGALPSDIDSSVEFLDNNLDYDSCESVAEHNWHTPLRAYNIVDDQIKSAINIDENSIVGRSNDRKSYGDTYFFNGSFFVIRKQVFLDCNGALPFRWRGNKIKPIIQESKYMEIDNEWQKYVFQGVKNEF